MGERSFRVPPRARAGVAAVAAVMLSFIPVAQATADEATIPVAKSAWFWSSNSKVTTCVKDAGACGGGSVGGGIFGNAAANPITPGHIPVSMKDGNPDMRSYLQFDLGAIQPGATIDKFQLVLTVSKPDQDHSPAHVAMGAQARPPATTNETAAAITACVVTEPWADNVSGGAGGDPPYSTKVVNPKDSASGEAEVETEKNEPFSDCSLNAPGRPSADGQTWVFDVTRIAATWVSGDVFNEGIALIPAPSTVAPTWTVEFHGPKLVLKGADESDVTYVTAKEEPRATAEYSGGAPPPIVDDGAGGGGGGFIEPPPPPFPTFGDPVADPAGGGSPTPPSVLGDQFINKGGGTVAVGSRVGMPAWVLGFFPLFILGMGLLASLIGNDPVGLVFAGNRSRVASVLQGRRLAGEGSVAAAQAITAEEITGSQDN